MKYKYKKGDKVRVYENHACDNCKNRILTIIGIDKEYHLYPYICSGILSENEIFDEDSLYLAKIKITNWKKRFKNEIKCSRNI